MTSVTATELPLIELALGQIFCQDVVFEGRWLLEMIRRGKFDWNSESYLPKPDLYAQMDDLQILATYHEKLQEIDPLPAIRCALGEECHDIEDQHEFAASLVLLQQLEQHFLVDWAPFWRRYTMSRRTQNFHERNRWATFFEADYRTLEHHVIAETDHFFAGTEGQLQIKPNARLQRLLKRTYNRYKDTPAVNIKAIGENCFNNHSKEYDWKLIAGIVVLQSLEKHLGTSFFSTFWCFLKLYPQIENFEKRFVNKNLL